MDLFTYIVCCNASPTCIIVAESKERAIQIVEHQAEIDFGGACDDHWIAYEINDYFSSGFYEPEFFGWVKHAGDDYI